MGSYFSLEGRVAIVTGGGGLLGIHHIGALRNAGATVVAVDILQPPALSERLESFFTPALLNGIETATCDITSEASLRSLKSQIETRHGKLDILVNNAAWNDSVEHREGEAHSSAFEHYPLESWNRALAVNLTGMYLACQILGPLMTARKSGSIINIASTYGMVGPDQRLYVSAEGARLMYKSPSYPTTKGGVIAFTKYLAAYWGESGVRVNTLSPGGVENSQAQFFVDGYSRRTMLGRMAAPSDYEGAIVFLASDASSYMTGANLVVDGGWTAW